MSEIKQIVGTCGAITMKGDWHEFEIAVEGKQYPVRLSTKLPDMIEQGKAVGQAVATWTFNESQGNPNPNRPGTFYMNRYLSKVEAGAVATQPAAQTGGAPSGGRDDLILRQTILKVLAPSINAVAQGAPESLLADVLTLAQRLEDAVVGGFVPKQASPPPSEPPQYEPDPTDAIPF